MIIETTLIKIIGLCLAFFSLGFSLANLIHAIINSRR